MLYEARILDGEGQIHNKRTFDVTLVAGSNIINSV